MAGKRRPDNGAPPPRRTRLLHRFSQCTDTPFRQSPPNSLRPLKVIFWRKGAQSSSQVWKAGSLPIPLFCIPPLLNAPFLAVGLSPFCWVKFLLGDKGFSRLVAGVPPRLTRQLVFFRSPPAFPFQELLQAVLPTTVWLTPCFLLQNSLFVVDHTLPEGTSAGSFSRFFPLALSPD